MNRETSNALRGLAARAIVSAIGDGEVAQTVTVETHEGVTRGGIEVLQQYGIASRAPEGAITVVIAIGGDQGDMIALPPGCPSDRFGGMQPGEVAIYDAGGSRVHLRAGGTIKVKAAAKVVVEAPEVEITAPVVRITGDVEVTGKVTATGEIQSGSIALTTHRHTGVTAGAATSGGPVS